MNTSTIMKFKDNGVVTATADQSLLDISKLLTQYAIGCIVIVEDGDKVRGIISEHDLIRAVGREGPKVLKEPVSDFMTVAVVTARKTDTQERLMSEMMVRHFRHLPVVEKDRLVGIVSLGDLIKIHVANAETESASLRQHITSA